MNEKLMERLRQAGVDVDGSLRRFSGNAALYERFLLKFPADENFGMIANAFAQQDLEIALTAAHTLKGVSGNLGMDRLYRASSETVALLRGNDAAGALASCAELTAAYEDVCKALMEEE